MSRFKTADKLACSLGVLALAVGCATPSPQPTENTPAKPPAQAVNTPAPIKRVPAQPPLSQPTQLRPITR
jgi:hypothetical protein